MNPYYALVAPRAVYRCEYCHAPERAHSLVFEVEHVHPRALGGRTEAGNLALACRACNLFKSDLTVAVDPDSLATVPLFNPRAQVWAEHFIVSDDDHVLDVTSVGRATVWQLRLNASQQVIARGGWRRLNLFP